MGSVQRLRVVKEPPRDAGGPLERAPDAGDLGLTAVLFVMSLFPIAGDLAEIGRWSPSIVGFAVAAAALSGRELWKEVRALVRELPKRSRCGRPHPAPRSVRAAERRREGPGARIVVLRWRHLQPRARA